jgi:hypothetical protein
MAPSLRSMLLAPVLLAVFVPAVGCAPNLLRGEVDGHPLDVVQAVHFEFRGTDPGTSQPTHPLTLWMMPVEDPCTEWPRLLSDLTALRAQLDGGQDPNDFCVEWADRWEQFSGGEPFWIMQFRLAAQPREDEQTPQTSYPYLDEDGAVAPTMPWFDATFAWHEAPTLERCAEVFAGTDYVPTTYLATGGEVTVDSYVVDEAIEGSIVLEMEAQGDDLITGAFDSTFCPTSGEWERTAPLRL